MQKLHKEKESEHEKLINTVEILEQEIVQLKEENSELRSELKQVNEKTKEMEKLIKSTNTNTSKKDKID